jgi:predicted P-loop ATPase
MRPPYGRYEISKPALSSFIGTVNNENGLLADPTGNRRYMFSKIDSIDWHGYMANIDVNAAWAEAKAAYLAGEPADLEPEELLLAEKINTSYEVEEPLEGIILQHFEIDPCALAWWTPTSEILQAIDDVHKDPITGESTAATYKGTTMSVSLKIASLMTSLGCERNRRRGAEGKNPQWGYLGVRKL